MTGTAARVRRYSSTTDVTADRVGGGIVVVPALTPEVGASMSAYTAVLSAGATAELPAPWAEVWVVLRGALRAGTDGDAVTARAGDFLHVPEQAPGMVEALEDTVLVCVSVPPH